MKLLLDVDGVLLNYVEALDVYARKNFGLKLVNENTYNLAYRYGGISFSAGALCAAFESSVAFQKLTPIPDAIKYITKLHYTGWRMRILTAAGNDSDIIMSRALNLRNVFGHKFSEIIHVGKKGSKKEYFTDPEEIYIEDNFNNIIDAKESGYTKTIFFKHPFTKEWNKNPGFWNWPDVYDEIQKLNNGN